VSAITPREKRAIHALINGSVMREKLDFIAGCSNSPELVAGLRRKGLEIPCARVKRFDKDGNSCWPGRYSLTPKDRLLAQALLRRAPQARTKGGRL
jgi:hypothetical protein